MLSQKSDNLKGQLHPYLLYNSIYDLYLLYNSIYNLYLLYNSIYNLYLLYNSIYNLYLLYNSIYNSYLLYNSIFNPCSLYNSVYNSHLLFITLTSSITLCMISSYGVSITLYWFVEFTGLEHHWLANTLNPYNEQCRLGEMIPDDRYVTCLSIANYIMIIMLTMTACYY